MLYIPLKKLEERRAAREARLQPYGLTEADLLYELEELEPEKRTPIVQRLEEERLMSGGPSLRLFSAAASQEQALSWLWPGYLPKGKVCIIEGDPEKGKGLISMDLAARVTRGDAVPLGDHKFPPGRVLITPGEDDWEDTIIPRLIVAGAKRDLVLGLRKDDASNFLFPRDLDDLGESVERFNGKDPDRPVCLILIDPLNQHIDDYNHPIKLRKHLTALSDFASRLGVVIVIVRHFNKDSDAKEAIYRGSGYIDVSGAARSVLQVWDVPGDEGLKAFAPVKANLAERSLTLLYKIEKAPAVDRRDEPLYDDRGEPATVGRIKWISFSQLTASQLMHGEKESKKTKAERWLESLLEKNGPMLRKDIGARAKEAGFKWPTVRDASGNIEDLSKINTPTVPKQSVWYLSRHGKPGEEQLKGLVEGQSDS